MGSLLAAGCPGPAAGDHDADGRQVVSGDWSAPGDGGPACACISPSTWLGYASCECATITWGCSKEPRTYKACNIPPTCWTMNTDPATGCPMPAIDSGCLGTCKGKPSQVELIGKPCTATGGECGAGHTCLLTSASAGVCTVSCTPDNPATVSIQEDDCPDLDKQVCGTVELLTGGQRASYCLERCAPQLGVNDCPAPLACAPQSAALAGLQAVKQAVCLLPGCASDADCPVRTSAACQVAASGGAAGSCPTGQRCLPLAHGATDGVCAQPGSCDLKSGLCAPHTLGKAGAEVGDPCQADTDCGGTMRCLMELDEGQHLGAAGQSCALDRECCSERCEAGTCAAGPCTLLYRNGYCTVEGCLFPSFAPGKCTPGSVCNRIYPGGLCQKTCDPTAASSCRGHAADKAGDYECRGWHNKVWPQDPAPADGAVCDFGTRVPCSYFLGKNGSCKLIGAGLSNTTEMACRDAQGNLLSDPFDADGFCLDKTGSGS